MVNTRWSIPLIIGIMLLAIGVGLILYGISSSPSILVQNSALRTYEVNIVMLIGVPPLCIGIAFLLFWLFTRSKA